MDRPNGFYWVRWRHTRIVDDQRWEPAEWGGGLWSTLMGEAFDDSWFREIGPRIKPPKKAVS